MQADYEHLEVCGCEKKLLAGSYVGGSANMIHQHGAE